MGIGILTTLFCAEPRVMHERAKSVGDWLNKAAWRPFAEFMRHHGWLAILVFAIVYKVGDAIGSNMSRPFYDRIGFSGLEILGVTKSFGIAATIAGALVGGVLVARYGIFRSLLIGGVAQAVTNLLFTWLSLNGHDFLVLTTAITVDNFTNSIGSIAFVAYLSSLCTKGLAATQYALLTSLVAFGRTVLASGSGKIATLADWPIFWALTALLAIPGLLLLLYLWRLERKQPAAQPA
jgi:PAT family beta-lactamase induction signal transducer AmpG